MWRGGQCRKGCMHCRPGSMHMYMWCSTMAVLMRHTHVAPLLGPPTGRCDAYGVFSLFTLILCGGELRMQHSVVTWSPRLSIARVRVHVQQSLPCTACGVAQCGPRCGCSPRRVIQLQLSPLPHGMRPHRLQHAPSRRTTRLAAHLYTDTDTIGTSRSIVYRHGHCRQVAVRADTPVQLGPEPHSIGIAHDLRLRAWPCTTLALPPAARGPAPSARCVEPAPSSLSCAPAV
mmetsp:Transcript_44302/g.88537  ORF Transcript_44302/g.88537 Transcript_44302/m.88537 type:complete len:231 (-) Transcript_44302:607-1299(-)